MRHLRMVRSVEPFLCSPCDPEATIERATTSLLRLGRIKPDDKLIIVSDVQAKDRRIDSIQLRTVAVRIYVFPSLVILSAAKDPVGYHICCGWILRCAQNDRWQKIG